MGGIRAGEHALGLEIFKAGLERSWAQAEKESGQKYNKEFFSREHYFYDSEPACRAVVTCRELNPEKVFEYKEILEKSFYVDNQDLTNPAVLVEKAGSIGLDEKQFEDLFHSESMKNETQKDFDLSDTLDVRGFPTILYSDGGKPEFFCKGFATLDEMEQLLLQYREGKKIQVENHPVCDITKSESC